MTGIEGSLNTGWAENGARRVRQPRLSRLQTQVKDALPHVGHFGPSMTVTTGGLDARNTDRSRFARGQVVARRLSVDEIKRLCSFPDDFRMEGPATQQRRRLGNSVPPLMARAWAERVRDAITRD